MNARGEKPDSVDAGLDLFQQLLQSIHIFNIFICFSCQMQVFYMNHSYSVSQEAEKDFAKGFAKFCLVLIIVHCT